MDRSDWPLPTFWIYCWKIRSWQSQVMQEELVRLCCSINLKKYFRIQVCSTLNIVAILVLLAQKNWSWMKVMSLGSKLSGSRTKQMVRSLHEMEKAQCIKRHSNTEFMLAHAFWSFDFKWIWRGGCYKWNKSPHQLYTIGNQLLWNVILAWEILNWRRMQLLLIATKHEEITVDETQLNCNKQLDNEKVLSDA